MTTIDFSPLFRSTVGFDHLDRLFDTVTREGLGRGAYPPYNIEKLGENSYHIALAVAGFRDSELDISLTDSVLTVAGRAEEPTPENVTYLHRGIAKRAFEHRFELAPTIKVADARLENGVLTVDLEREIPEHMKPRQIAIRSEGAKRETLEQKQAS